MAVAYCEEMAMSEAHYVRVSDIRVLVYLIRIVRRDASFRCERELGYNVDYLVLRARRH